MNSEDALDAGGKSGGGGAGDSRGMGDRRGVLHPESEDLDRIGMRAVCCADGDKINSFRSSGGRPAQGGCAIAKRYKCYATRQVASVAQGRFGMSISGCNT